MGSVNSPDFKARYVGRRKIASYEHLVYKINDKIKTDHVKQEEFLADIKENVEGTAQERAHSSSALSF